MLLPASLAYFFLLRPPWPISFSWASSAHFNSTFLWAFANSFELPRPNYHILYFWGSWTCHQPFTFLPHYLGLTGTHSYFSTSQCPWVYYFSFSGLLQAHLLSSRPIYLLYRPMTPCSCHLGLAVSLSIYQFFPIHIVGLLPAIRLLPKWASTDLYIDTRIDWVWLWLFLNMW